MLPDFSPDKQILKREEYCSGSVGFAELINDYHDLLIPPAVPEETEADDDGDGSLLPCKSQKSRQEWILKSSSILWRTTMSKLIPWHYVKYDLKEMTADAQCMMDQCALNKMEG